jgi:hypothetical protein
MHHPDSIYTVRDLQARIEVKKEIMEEEEWSSAAPVCGES